MRHPERPEDAARLHWVHLAGEDRHGHLEMQHHTDTWTPGGYTREMDRAPRPPSPDRYPHLQGLARPIPEDQRRWQLLTPLREPLDHLPQQWNQSPPRDGRGRLARRPLDGREREVMENDLDYNMPRQTPAEKARMQAYMDSVRLLGPGRHVEPLSPASTWSGRPGSSGQAAGHLPVGQGSEQLQAQQGIALREPRDASNTDPQGRSRRRAKPPDRFSP